MPTMPVVNGPIGSVGGAMAIPTRASVAAMAAQPAAQVAAAPVPAPRSRTKTSPPQPMTAIPVEPAPVAPPPEPYPVEAVEGQPTIPIRTLTEEEIEPEPAVGPSARLFVLTTDLAGLEVSLEKPSLVIGRTDENDVVLSHRSISRHHAKIVREGDRYTIVDLQSANGVRVNGEDYERIELNPGDVLELGHVKLRFVGPQEQFVFDGRVPPLGAPPAVLAGGRRWGRAGRRGCRGSLLASRWAPGRRATGGRRRGAGRRGPRAHAAPPPPVAAEAPPPPPPAPAPKTPATPAALLAAAKTAAAAEDWESAETALLKLDSSAAEPGVRREAAALSRKVETERQGAALYARFDQAANEKDYAAAIAGYVQIPPDSMYRKRGQARYQEARALLIAQHMTAAENARAEGRCADVRLEAGQVLRLDPKNMLVRDLSRMCRARPEAGVAAVAPRPVRTRQVSTVALAERGEAPRRADGAGKGEGGESTARGEAARAMTRRRS